MKKIITVLGARPQIIKASAVSNALAEISDITELMVHTGQHYDENMSDIFFSELGIRQPHYNLGINRGSHGSMTGEMLAAIEKVLLSERPDVVLVYGDTNSTLAGALAAVKLHIPVAHVEAGLRSFNMRMPEEINRILTDRISHWLFAPTEVASANLRSEGVRDSKINVVGDVMYDVAMQFALKVRADDGALDRVGVTAGSYVLATIHRAENTDSGTVMAGLVDSLRALSGTLPVVWPIHPRTRITLEKAGMFDKLVGSVKVIEPVGYLDMARLEKYAAVIVTDSGGVQKEAFFHRTPCVTVRDETEWTELVDAGWNRLIPPTRSTHLVAEVLSAIGSQGKDISPYGNGDASRKIASVISEAKIL